MSDYPTLASADTAAMLDEFRAAMGDLQVVDRAVAKKLGLHQKVHEAERFRVKLAAGLGLAPAVVDGAILLFAHAYDLGQSHHGVPPGLGPELLRQAIVYSGAEAAIGWLGGTGAVRSARKEGSEELRRAGAGARVALDVMNDALEEARWGTPGSAGALAAHSVAAQRSITRYVGALAAFDQDKVPVTFDWRNENSA